MAISPGFEIQFVSEVNRDVTNSIEFYQDISLRLKSDFEIELQRLKKLNLLPQPQDSISYLTALKFMFFTVLPIFGPDGTSRGIVASCFLLPAL
jgi:hypothetical protein